VLVGDFRQLPPIVQSNEKSTVKWLGRDIFEVSGLKDAYECKNPPDYFIALRQQRRMLPEIAEVANQFYDGFLETPAETRGDFSCFREWFALDWGYDSPVLLVDTGPIDAWVTSVVRGGRSSRLNFLSATVTVDLAEQLLRKDRPTPEVGSSNRILLVSPYRPHAKLVSVMLGENSSLRDEVIAGTAHSFQGSEADVVIFDLVVDEPHFRVNLFMPSLDDSLKGLMNVALTRAKFRLIVVGDFAYCSSHAKKAFLGRKLIPFLQHRFPCVSASDVVPNGLAARAAKAQMAMLGGNIEPNSKRIVVTQRDFYRVLSGDLASARTRVIIYSPFMTQDRISMLRPQLAAATERGVAVTVITKSHQERRDSEMNQIRRLEAELSDIGAIVMHKLRMHEKLVFIDDCVTWNGSLNPLSFSNTQEVMERRCSRTVMTEYFKALRLDELLAVSGTNACMCPICGSELMAAEGADQPYYWRCVNDDCYARSIDQPYPSDGVLSCHRCGEPVEFGYWGESPCWRCTSNSRHRQKVFKSHLRLPKMAGLIPTSERRKVCQIFGISSTDVYAHTQAFASMGRAEQGELFEGR
jgi:hypothetical protein